MTLDDFFAEQAESRRLFEAVQQAVETAGPVEIRVSKSQVSFRNRRTFAWVWMPGQYLRGKTAPLVLTLAFFDRDSSPRWKEVVEPRPGRFTHHLELYSADDIDDEVRGWLQKAWAQAA